MAVIAVPAYSHHEKMQDFHMLQNMDVLFSVLIIVTLIVLCLTFGNEKRPVVGFVVGLFSAFAKILITLYQIAMPIDWSRGAMGEHLSVLFKSVLMPPVIIFPIAAFYCIFALYRAQKKENRLPLRLMLGTFIVLGVNVMIVVSVVRGEFSNKMPQKMAIGESTNLGDVGSQGIIDHRSDGVRVIRIPRH